MLGTDSNACKSQGLRLRAGLLSREVYCVPSHTVCNSRAAPIRSAATPCKGTRACPLPKFANPPAKPPQAGSRSNHASPDSLSWCVVLVVGGSGCLADSIKSSQRINATPSLCLRDFETGERPNVTSPFRSEIQGCNRSSASLHTCCESLVIIALRLQLQADTPTCPIIRVRLQFAESLGFAVLNLEHCILCCEHAPGRACAYMLNDRWAPQEHNVRGCVTAD